MGDMDMNIANYAFFTTLIILGFIQNVTKFDITISAAHNKDEVFKNATLIAKFLIGLSGIGIIVLMQFNYIPSGYIVLPIPLGVILYHICYLIIFKITRKVKNTNTIH